MTFSSMELKVLQSLRPWPHGMFLEDLAAHVDPAKWKSTRCRRALVRDVDRTLKRLHDRQLVTSCMSDPRALWRLWETI